MLKASNLSCSINGTDVLDNVSFAVFSNEILGITGGPGCGKSLILNIISGRLKKFTGELILDEKPLQGIKAADFKKIVSSYTSLKSLYNPDSIIFDKVLSGRKIYKSILHPFTDLDREITAKYIEQLELTNYSRMKLRNVSESIIQMSMLAATINMECEIMLLDSPESVLNYRQKNILGRLLKKYSSAAGRSIVIASSDIDFLATTCDRLIVIHEGKITESGSHEMIDESFLKRYFNINAMVSRNVITSMPEIHIIDME